MQSIGIHKVIDRMISFLRRIGLWHGEDRPTVSQLRWKSFCVICYLLLPLSFSIGAATTESLDESVFLAETSIVVTIMGVKIWILLWKQKEIVRLLNRVCAFSIRHDEEFAFFNAKMERFIKFVIGFLTATIFASLGFAVSSFIGNKKTFIVNLAFPLDWKNSEIGFWMAYIFLEAELVLSFLSIASSIIIWYLLLHCSLRYRILGAEIRKMGGTTGMVKMSKKEQQTIFDEDLVASIQGHLHIKGLVDDVESFLSNLFLLQFATSATCLCASIYCLAFNISVNLVERLVHVYLFFYNIAELFIITYFGNEIMLSCSGLAYSLFETEWTEQPQSTKKCIIIFGEYLRQSHTMVIGKLYPLTLETFSRILNSSYSLFNILQNIKQ